MASSPAPLFVAPFTNAEIKNVLRVRMPYHKQTRYAVQSERLGNSIARGMGYRARRRKSGRPKLEICWVHHSVTIVRWSFGFAVAVDDGFLCCLRAVNRSMHKRSYDVPLEHALACFQSLLPNPPPADHAFSILGMQR